jgi:hypothetical protein
MPEYPFEIDAVIKRKNDPDTGESFWVAAYDQAEARVSAVDAWNSDISNDLPVRIKVTSPSTCRIITRLRNNKRFVKIRKV